jgi:hypothetical protein
MERKLFCVTGSAFISCQAKVWLFEPYQVLTMVLEGVHWIKMVQKTVQWQVLVNTVMNFQVPQKVELSLKPLLGLSRGKQDAKGFSNELGVTSVIIHYETGRRDTCTAVHCDAHIKRHHDTQLFYELL